MVKKVILVLLAIAVLSLLTFAGCRAVASSTSETPEPTALAEEEAPAVAAKPTATTEVTPYPDPDPTLAPTPTEVPTAVPTEVPAPTEIPVYGWVGTDEEAEEECAAVDIEAADAYYEITQADLPYYSGFEKGEEGNRRPVGDALNQTFTLIIGFPEGADRAILDKVVFDDEPVRILSCPPKGSGQHARNLLPIAQMAWVTKETLSNGTFTDNWLLIADTRRQVTDPAVGNELKQSQYSVIPGALGHLEPGHFFVFEGVDTVGVNVGADAAFVSDITAFAFTEDGHAYDGAWTYTPMTKDWGREIDMAAYLVEMEAAQAAVYAAIKLASAK